MNAIMQISEGIITIGFVLAFIIICKRKRIHRNAFKRIAIVLLLSFIAFIIVQAIPPLTDTIKLEALGEKNEASSSDEILVHAYHIDNKEYKVKSATVGEWLWLDYYGWINANDERCPDGITQSIELQVPVGVSRGISFVSGPFCGMVSMETVDGNTYTIDTYCAEEGFLSCNIGRSNWKLLLLNCIIRIAVFISIMCVMIWHLIRVLVKCNSDIASTQTGWGKNQKKYALAAIALFITIIMTRSFCLMHEMENHPDEHVFIAASESLADVFLNPSHEYTEEKPYPEGSYIFFAPFQLLAKLVQHYSGTVQSLPLYNRIGSVFYFALGAIVGCIILVKYIKNKQSVIYYAILITFSLLHIEQSRYGTADPLSFFLLMLIIYTSITWLADVKQKRYIYIYIISARGILGSMQIPVNLFLHYSVQCIFS